MAIRYGRQTDKKNYLRVQKEAFPNINSKRDSKLFDMKIKNKEIFVLDDNEYVGHICFGKHLFNPPFAPAVFIEELAVSKQYRGKGCGTILINRLIAFCKTKKISTIYLGSCNKNKNYYKKLGFKEIGYLDDTEFNKEYKQPQYFYAIKVK